MLIDENYGKCSGLLYQIVTMQLFHLFQDVHLNQLEQVLCVKQFKKSLTIMNFFDKFYIKKIEQFT